MTEQLTFQIINSLWHLTADIVLTLQWLFFRQLDVKRIQLEDKREFEILAEESVIHHRRLSLEQALELHDDHVPMHVSRERPELSAPRAPIIPPLLARTRDERPVSVRRGRRTKALLAALAVVISFGMVAGAIALGIIDKARFQKETVSALSGGAGRTTDKTRLLIGSVISWVCASMYLGSRFPVSTCISALLLSALTCLLQQIYHNYSRKSVQGLSISLFAMATLANITVSIHASMLDYVTDTCAVHIINSSVFGRPQAQQRLERGLPVGVTSFPLYGRRCSLL